MKGGDVKIIAFDEIRLVQIPLLDRPPLDDALLYAPAVAGVTGFPF